MERQTWKKQASFPEIRETWAKIATMVQVEEYEQINFGFIYSNKALDSADYVRMWNIIKLKRRSEDIFEEPHSEQENATGTVSLEK